MKIKKIWALVIAVVLLLSLTSCAGKSAYEVAVENGFSGTANDWLASLKGDRGPQGAKGEQGEQGIQGEQGDQGVPGEKGDQGEQGEQGLQGEQGEQGIQGESGEPGIQGEKGEKGDQGEQGEKGDKGDKGDQGIRGEKGDKGDQGEQGIQGEKGDKGDDAVHAHEKHTVTFNTNGGKLPKDAASEVEVNYGDVLTLPVPTRDNYTFEGWYTGDTVNDGKFTSVTPVTKTITLIARWKADTQYRVVFNTQGGNGISPKYYDFDEVITALPTPVKSGCVFEGWYLDEELNNRVGYPLMLTENMEIYAKWSVAYYYVNFHTGCDATIPSLYGEVGTSYDSFSAPEYPDHVFEGWYLDSGFKQAVTYPFVPSSDVDLYAKWDKQYFTFTFVSNGGSDVPSEKYASGYFIDSLPTPERTNHRFGGWYTDGDLQNKVSLPYEVTTDTFLYAKWIWVDPFVDYTRISDYSDLQSITDPNGKYVLTADIDCEGLALPTIGANSTTPFRGVFEGQGYTISNYTLTNSQYTGLFGYNMGTIRNLNLSNFSISIETMSTDVIVGGIAGCNAGVIQRCSVTNASIYVKLNVTRYGGLITGKNTGTIENCYADGEVKIDQQTQKSDKWGLAGGVAGTNHGSIVNCFVNAYVYAYGVQYAYHYGEAALISAVNESSGKISGCVVMGTVEGGNNRKGDISGRNDGVIENCYKDVNLVLNNPTHTYATAMSRKNLSNSTFYSASLKWDPSIWDWSFIDLDNGTFPKLIQK